jgi:chromate transporter
MPTPRLDILTAFTRLGLTSFGGPIAHIGYFRAEFVQRRAWLTEAEFADIVSLCQFLPGPASSQTGFAIGLHRGGWQGALLAWAGFTLPSACLMVAFAYGAAQAAGSPILHGLNLVAVAIVAQAVWGMARALCPDPARRVLACLAFMVALARPASAGQIAVILLGAVAGLLVCRGEPRGQSAAPAMPRTVSPATACVCLAGFAALLVLPEFVPGQHPVLAIFSAFSHAGALVFGGGHVVLPLLRDAVVMPGLVSEPAFLSGYGAAQAVPGPLFTVAAYLGAVLRGPVSGLPGAALALIAIFLPGLLLVTGVQPFWHALKQQRAARASMRGVNAAVVGLLAAALYDPVWVGAVHRPADITVVVALGALLLVWRVPPIIVVGAGAMAGLGLAH